MTEEQRDHLRPRLPGGGPRGRSRPPAAEPRGPVHVGPSVNEFLLVKQAGFEPVGLCVGSSIYHIGIQMAGWKKNQEMTVLSEAMYGARQLAMTRMEEEADQLGADGVVGVRLDIGRYEWGQDMAEFIAIGTARQAPRRRPAPRAQRAARSPATCRARTSGRCCAPATGRWGW